MALQPGVYLAAAAAGSVAPGPADVVNDVCRAVAMRLSMPAPLRVLRDALGLGSHAFVCVGNNVGGDVQQLSASYLGSVLRDVRVSAGFGLVRYRHPSGANNISSLHQRAASSLVPFAGQKRRRGTAGAQLLHPRAAAAALWRPSASRPADRAGHGIFVSEGSVSKSKAQNFGGGCIERGCCVALLVFASFQSLISVQLTVEH